jgi:hypothetical protein
VEGGGLDWRGERRSIVLLYTTVLEPVSAMVVVRFWDGLRRESFGRWGRG